jgi:hypoxanthine phosphoribosyltransferase
VKAEHWGTPAEQEDRAVIRYPLCIPLEGAKVLIVDDVTDTGESMALVLEYVKALGPAEVRTAVLQHKEVSTFLPDYYAEVCPVWQWIVYPWALHEDLLGFSRRLLAGKPLTPGELRAELASGFRFTATEEDIGFALEDLVASGEIVREGSRYRRKGD